MPGRDDLREAVGRVVALHKSEYDWYDDPGAVADERITAVLAAIEQAGYRIVRADRLIEVSSVSTMTGNPGTWGKREEEGER